MLFLFFGTEMEFVSSGTILLYIQYGVPSTDDVHSLATGICDLLNFFILRSCGGCIARFSYSALLYIICSILHLLQIFCKPKQLV